MAISISNDKIPSTVNPKTDGSNQKNMGKTAGATQEASSHPAPDVNPQTDETLDIDRANHLYNSTTRNPSEPNNNISTLEQAAELTTRIHNQLTDSGVLALQAHAKVTPNHVGTLLNAAP